MRLQNVDVGNVVSLRIVPEHQHTPVQIKMKVAGKATDFLKKDSVVMLTTVGALGETYVNIDSTCGHAGAGQRRRYASVA